MEHGVNKIGEGKRIMLNVSIDSLLNKALENLPPEKLIFELVPSQIQIGSVVINQALKSAQKFKEAGILVAASYDILLKDSYQQFVEEAFLITVDFRHLTDPKVTSLKAKGKKLLITKIENEKEYSKALEIGDFFQGNYLESPYVLKEFEIAPYLKNTLVRLIAMLLFLLAMNDYIIAENPNLWKKALTRAFLASEMARRIIPDLESAAYLMGLFSLIDEILRIDKIRFLKEVNIDKVILDGYTGKHKKLRELLDFASQLEEKYSIIQSSEDHYDSPMLTNIEKVSGIHRLELLQMTRDAYEKAEYVLNL
ncbi:hypothetical protein [Thermocrinis sp.]|uniref:hypothetical protein n=1 Tax=Thermocrinis sp. TaxID=2024383 RepID=UPI002FDE95E3